jgi:hypothetical protein
LYKNMVTTRPEDSATCTALRLVQCGVTRRITDFEKNLPE